MEVRSATMRERWRLCATYCATYMAAVAIFAGSRLVVLLAIAFSSRFVTKLSGDDFWDATPAWYRYLLRYDSAWYLMIASEGYSYNGNDLVYHPVVFYPLYPLISRGITTLFGIPETLSLLIVSNASILLAVVLACRLVKDLYGDEVALYTVALLSFFPTSLFFSAGYTESLTLLLIVIFFLMLRSERLFLAAGAAGLAMATRSTGVVLMLPLLWELWRKFSGDGKRLLLHGVACLVLATSGLWLYMVYLWWAFNSPLAFIKGTRAWQSGTTTGSDFFQVLTLQPLQHLTEIWREGIHPNTFGPWFFLSFVIITIVFWKKLPTSFSLFALGTLLLPYITLSGNVGFVSFTRYILLAFPVFTGLAILCRRWLWFGPAVIGVFAALLFMYTAMFAQWYWVG